MQPPSPVAKQLHRHLGLWSVVSISTGAMMGSGIFVLPLLAAEIAGPWVALSYLLAGLLVIPAVLSKAELATAMPVSGGTYIYLDRSMGPWMGTIGGLGTWLALSAKTAFALVGLGAYLVIFADLPALPFSLAVLAALVALNVLGAGKATMMQIAIVVVSVSSLIAFSAVGFGSVELVNLSPAFPMGAAGILGGAGFVFVSYNGVTKVCSIAEEIVEPERNIPLGMGISLLLVMALYAVLATVITGNVPYASTHHDVTPIATAAEVILGRNGMLLMSIVAVMGLISMCNAGVLATARFPLAMSRDGLMPPALQQVHPTLGTPARAILFTGVLLLLLVLAFPVAKLAKLASGFTIFIFAVENLAVMVLRETGPGWYRPSFRSPLYPWTQLLGILGCGVMLTGLGWFPMLGIVAAILLGTGWFFAYGKQRTVRTSAFAHLFEPRILQATEAAERHDPDELLVPRVLVPIFGHEPAPGRLVRLAGAFAETGVLEVLRLEEVPEGMDLGGLVRSDQTMRRLARQSEVLAQDLHLEVTFHDVLTHNAKRALHDHARETRAEWIVMEWPTRRAVHYLVRHPMAWWLEHPPCDLAIFKDRTPAPPPGEDDPLGDSPTVEVRRGFARILVLAEPGPYDSLLVHVADNLARQSQGEITLFLAAPVHTDDARIEAHEAYHSQLMRLCRAQVISRVLRTDHPIDAVTTLSEQFDLLIMGAPPEHGLRTLLLGSGEDHIADRAACSVLRLKAPRDRVHHRLPTAGDVPRPDFSLAPFVAGGVMVAGLELNRKEELFQRIAQELVALDPGRPAPDISAALWKREQRQNTALRGGVALSAPVMSSLRTTFLGVFTLRESLDYQSPDQGPVRVMLVVIAPPHERQNQLWVLERITEMLMLTDLTQRLVACTSSQQLREALGQAEGQVEQI